MKITIYQIIPELDQDRLMFMPLSYFQKAGYPSPPAEIYESVFCGETEVATLEEIYRIFNCKDEADARYLEKIGFTGHSMSVSDILEIQHSPGESRFYFCDTFGFSQIAFQKENAMLPVQNHDNIPFEQVNRSKPGYLAYMDNGGISIHPCIQVQLQRCKYSQCQLGYRLRYQEKEVTQLAEPTEQEIRQMREEIEEAKKEKSRAYHRQYSREYRARNLEKQREYERIKAREYRARRKAQTAAAQPAQ